jgi:hypothetical protein
MSCYIQIIDFIFIPTKIFILTKFFCRHEDFLASNKTSKYSALKITPECWNDPFKIIKIPAWVKVYKCCLIFSYQGNANENYTESSSHPSDNGCHQESKQQQILVEMSMWMCEGWGKGCSSTS